MSDFHIQKKIEKMASNKILAELSIEQLNSIIVYINMFTSKMDQVKDKLTKLSSK